jgi:photosystem II stability/assembly factor-like uncharacterized protein
MPEASTTRRAFAQRVFSLAAAAASVRAGAATPELHPALRRPALKAARPAQAFMVSVVRAGQRLVAAGEHGLVVFSDDGGRQWTQAQVPASVTLTGLRFADARQGWAIGNLGLVLRTSDGGATWRRVLDGQAASTLVLQAAREATQVAAAGPSSAQASALLDDAQRLVAEGADKPFFDLALRPDGSLWVLGAYGLAFASTDKGETWQSRMHRLPNPEGLSYHGLVERRDEQFLFGEQGLLLRAARPADPFTASPSPSTGSFFGAVALREGPLLLLGLRGKAWRSANVGEPWTMVQTPVDASLLAGLQLVDGRAVLAGAAGQLLVSEDAGQGFRPVALKTRFPFSAVAAAADGGLVLAGARGLVRVELAELRGGRA